MVPVPAELNIVRRILRLRKRGQSYRAIAATLSADGVPSKHAARWHHTTVRKVVQRRAWYAPYL